MSTEMQYLALTDAMGYEPGPQEQSPVEHAEALRKDAERYRWLKTRAKEEGRDGGWTGMFSFYPVPAWDDTPYACQRGVGFNFRGNIDAAIDAAMSRTPAVGAA